MRTSLRALAALLLFFLCLLHCLAPATAQARNKEVTSRQVLLLNSYHPGYNWNVMLLDGIHQVLNYADIPLRIRYEFMDSKHYTTDAFVDELRSLYREKYKNITFDVIIASDNDAFHFLKRYRDKLFPGVPVVFCGVNGFTMDMVEGFANATGTGEYFDLKGTAEVALRLHPQARHLVMVGGEDTSSRTNRRMLREVLAQFSNRVELIDLSGLDTEELSARLKLLPPDAVIIYISYYLTPNGTRLTVEESISLVSRASQLPMYTAWSHLLSHGMVGGKMLRPEDQGRTAAELAMRILHGEKADSIPVLQNSPTYHMFDASRVRHFSIPPGDLPADAILVNEDTSLFGRYRSLALLASGLLLYQTGVIIWLLLSARRRKRAEEHLRRDQALRAQLEEQLFHAQKLEAIDTFAGGIAHDFNNILESMACCCELALEDVPPHSTAFADLRQALQSGQRGKALIRRLLDFSRRSPSRMGGVSLSRLTTECLGMLRPMLPAGVELRTAIEPAPMVVGDPDKLTQLIMNLCINAGQAMQEEQKRRSAEGLAPRAMALCVSVTHSPPEANNSATDEGPPMVRLTVSDTGCGIAPELLPRIFDPFFTTRPKSSGTGLGLAVTQGIVRHHNGRIEAHSTWGEGATFSVLFPVAPPNTAPLPEDPATLPPGGGERVLLVDDDASVGRPLARRLERLGYAVALADTPLAALDMTKGEQHWGLLLTDYDMPGMNGVELARRVHEEKPELPVLLLTGMGRDELPGDAALREVGVHALLHKPVDFALLARSIRALLDTPLPR